MVVVTSLNTRQMANDVFFIHCQVKIWDVMADRRQRRTYQGHSAAVRDVTFSPDGLKFLRYGEQIEMHVTV